MAVMMIGDVEPGWINRRQRKNVAFGLLEPVQPHLVQLLKSQARSVPGSKCLIAHCFGPHSKELDQTTKAGCAQQVYQLR